MGKMVIIDSYVEWPAGTDRSDQFSSFNMEPVRAEIESGVFGDNTEKAEAGTYTNTLNCNVRPDADWVFLTLLIQQQKAGANVPILYRSKAGIKATDNPEMTCPVLVTKIPPLGGDRGTLLGGQMQLRINGPIHYDNITVQIDIGG